MYSLLVCYGVDGFSFVSVHTLGLHLGFVFFACFVVDCKSFIVAVLHGANSMLEF